MGWCHYHICVAICSRCDYGTPALIRDLPPGGDISREGNPPFVWHTTCRFGMARSFSQICLYIECACVCSITIMCTIIIHAKHTILTEQISGSCANPAEPIKKPDTADRQPLLLVGYRKNSKNAVKLGNRDFPAPEQEANPTTKDILALLQIFLHIPFERSMGLAESLFGKCRNGSPA